MKKRVFIIHRWDGNPKGDLYPWLKTEIEKNGFEVHVPEMPNTSEPKIDEWVGHLNKTVGKLDKGTYFIGHSIGCQTIMRYLQDKKIKIGGAVFVAGWFNLDNLEDEEVESIAKPWMEDKIELDNIKKIINKLTVILSDNDPYDFVGKNKKIFEDKFGAKVIIKKGMGHFTEED